MNNKNLPHRNQIEGYYLLKELALDLVWSWTHMTDIIWKELDAELWELTHNPWVVLQTVSKKKLISKLTDIKFSKLVEELVENNRNENKAKTWFQENHQHSPLKCVAYFSMEYMLAEALPIYSGGLGNVAGDQLKSASDLGVPVVAIGLLYQQGYFRQIIDRNGSQQALYPFNDPDELPITPLKSTDGERLRLKIELPECTLWIRAWNVKVGRVNLLLLDTNDPANPPSYRCVTSELYGGGSELRLRQEILLGIGGYRLLEALAIKPEVCHLNEGHAAFLVLERARFFMEENGLSFEEALATTRAGNHFTTHTAVSAGFDLFCPELLKQYLGNYVTNKLHISFEEFFALGRQNPADQHEFFNMAYLAIRGSGSINGVSKLHGEVSRLLFQHLFPRFPENEIPVGYVTNGVHTPSWDSIPADKLWTEACGKDRWQGETEQLEKKIRAVPDEKIWQMRNESRNWLVQFTRHTIKTHSAVPNAFSASTKENKPIFDPNILTLGFARRFATYKRPNLLLHDPERFIRILNNLERPVQLIIAGKAHPADLPGQALIHEWMDFIRREDVWPKVVFLPYYDMQLTEQMVQGVDVWINTPRRPWEACGTSGMKILVNGGLNVSELDGWWAEAYNDKVGWALGDGLEHGADPSLDAAEANDLYSLLENEIIPKFYKRDQRGIPTEWIAQIRESMATLTPKYSANRTVREYTEKYYLSAAEEYIKRASNKGKLGKQLTNWKRSLNDDWKSIKFEKIELVTNKQVHQFEVQLFLGKLDSNSVKVQLYANSQNGSSPYIQEMEKTSSNNQNICTYRASVPVIQPAANYTPRVIPNFSGVSVPLEMEEILWAH